MTQELLNLSNKLRDLHQELTHSKSDQALRFKSLSDLFNRIDEKLQSKEEIEILDVQLIFDQTSGLFKGENRDFTAPYQTALGLNPHLAMKQAEVFSALQKLQPWVKNMHEMHSVNEKNRFQNPQ